MASSIRWLKAICSGRSAIPWVGSKSLKMWSIMLWAFCLFSNVNTIISPIILVCDFRSHHICARTPDEIGSSMGQVGQDLRGRIPGVSAAFNPRAAPQPGSQAVRWCLIVYPDRVYAGGLAKGRPTQVAFSLGRSRQRPCFWEGRWRWHKDRKSVPHSPTLWRALWDARLSGWFPVLLV